MPVSAAFAVSAASSVPVPAAFAVSAVSAVSKSDLDAIPPVRRATTAALGALIAGAFGARATAVVTPAPEQVKVKYKYKGNTSSIQVRKDIPARALYSIFSGIVRRPVNIRINAELLSDESDDDAPVDITNELEITEAPYIELAQLHIGWDKTLWKIPLAKQLFTKLYDSLNADKKSELTTAVQLAATAENKTILQKLQAIAKGSRIISRGTNECAFSPAVPYDGMTNPTSFVSTLYVDNESAITEFNQLKHVSDLDTNENCRFTAMPIGVYAVQERNIPIEYYTRACGTRPGARPVLPTHEIVHEYGGVDTGTMLLIIGKDVRTLAIAMYPLFYGIATISAHNLLPEALLYHTMAFNVLYNVETRKCVFVNYNIRDGSSNKYTKEKYVQRFISGPVKNILQAMFLTRDERKATSYDKLLDTIADSKLPPKDALKAYEAFLKTEYNYTPKHLRRK